MRSNDHALLANSLGSQKTLRSFHFGTPGQRPKVYIQASLHAEELPGMLVAHHLRTQLEAADAAGQVQGEIILVPMANPIGLAQRVDHKPMGRFDLDSSENFNRHYPDLAKAIAPAVQDALGQDAQANVALVRRAMGHYLRDWLPATELQSLRRTLLTLAHDADFVLDLHCDCEAVMHFYAEEGCWPPLEPLAHFLGSEAILLARNTGSGPFDECLSSVWWQLADRLTAAGHTVPLPPFKCQPTPLAGSETLKVPAPGIVVFAARVGDTLAVGDLVVEVIDPIANQTHRVLAGVAGIFYARIRDRYINTGGELGKIASAKAFRTGELLGA